MLTDIIEGQGGDGDDAVSLRVYDYDFSAGEAREIDPTWGGRRELGYCYGCGRKAMLSKKIRRKDRRCIRCLLSNTKANPSRHQYRKCKTKKCKNMVRVRKHSTGYCRNCCNKGKHKHNGNGKVDRHRTGAKII